MVAVVAGAFCTTAGSTPTETVSIGAADSSSTSGMATFTGVSTVDGSASFSEEATGALDWLSSDRADRMAARLVCRDVVVLVVVRLVLGISQDAGVVTASVATGIGINELLRIVEEEEREDVVTGDVMVLAVARRVGEERDVATELS